MIGKTITHYQIIGKIGDEGLGLLHRTLDARLNRTIALKLLIPWAHRRPRDKKTLHP